MAVIDAGPALSWVRWRLDHLSEARMQGALSPGEAREYEVLVVRELELMDDLPNS